MKIIVFVILIAFVPIMLTGCQREENIVEKLAPEQTLEDVYRGETLAILRVNRCFRTGKKDSGKWRIPSVHKKDTPNHSTVKRWRICL